jgi:ankyrin repeat protein
MNIFHYLIERKNPLSFIEKIAAGKMEAVKEALAAAPKLLSTLSPDGFTPLTIAAYFSQEEIARFLVERGADVNLASSNHMQVAPLHSAVAIQNIPLAKLFLENGAEVNKSQMEGIRPLHSAVHRGQVKMVELLLKHGADPNLATDDGRTAFNIAAAEGKEEVKKVLGV